MAPPTRRSAWLHGGRLCATNTGVRHGFPDNSLRVGIADDVGCAREALARMLEALGHEVVFQAERGRELVQACLEHRPEVVITEPLT
jgi:PleD family two-component response regulator